MDRNGTIETHDDDDDDDKGDEDELESSILHFLYHERQSSET